MTYRNYGLSSPARGATYRINQTLGVGHLSFQPARIVGLGIGGVCRNIAIAPEQPSREELA